MYSCSGALMKKQVLLFVHFQDQGKESRKYILTLRIQITKKYKCHIMTFGTQPAWDVSERSQSDLHWERHLRDLLETSQKRLLFCDVFKTSQTHLKKDVFFVTSLGRLKSISRKYLWFFKNTPQKWFCVISVGLLQYLRK